MGRPVSAADAAGASLRGGAREAGVAAGFGSWRASGELTQPHCTRAQDSPRCHEATVVFNLLRLLTWDLRLVAHAGPCV